MSPASITPAALTAVPGDGRPSRPGLVRRDRLLSRLDAARDTPVVLLVAPAGFGKTTILADWTTRDERASGWLALDERHNDPVLLLGAITAQLNAIEPIGEEV